MLPVVSQIKTGVQMILGDREGAARTTMNYLNDGLGTSQLRSGYFLLKGDSKQAGEIQSKFLNNLEPLVDGLPIVGQAKGVYHLANNDTEHGWQAIKSSTSSVGTVVGALAAGPAGAISGHLITDVLISGVGAVATGNISHAHGLVEYLNKKDVDVGGHFDAMTSLVLDATSLNIGAKASKASSKAVTTAVSKVATPKAAKSHTEQTRLLYKNHGDEESRVTLIDDAHETKLEKEEGTVTQLDDVQEKKPVEGVSSPVRSEGYQYVSNDLTNRIKMFKFNHFIKSEKDYTSVAAVDKWTAFSLNKLSPYTRDAALKRMDLESFVKKLKYLSEDQMSLIKLNDFRQVNTSPHEPNTLLNSVAGILSTDVVTLMKNLDNSKMDTYNSYTDYSVVNLLEKCKSKNLLTYVQSQQLNGLSSLDSFLKTYVNKLEGKQLLLRKIVNNDVGVAVVLRFKISPVIEHPIKLFIDFQTPPMLTRQLPNPYRFEHFVDDKFFKAYVLYIIENKNIVKKSN